MQMVNEKCRPHSAPFVPTPIFYLLFNMKIKPWTTTGSRWITVYQSISRYIKVDKGGGRQCSAEWSRHVGTVSPAGSRPRVMIALHLGVPGHLFSLPQRPGARRRLGFMERTSVNLTEHLWINAAPASKDFTEKFPLTLAGRHSLLM
jgi:hypothetical protein